MVKVAKKKAETQIAGAPCLHWSRPVQQSLRAIVSALQAAEDAAEAFPGSDEPDLENDLQRVAGTCQLLREAVSSYGIADAE